MAKYTDMDLERAQKLMSTWREDARPFGTDARLAHALAAVRDGHPSPFDADTRLAQAFADVREECAAVADDMAKGESRTPVEKAIGATIARRIRGGGR
jgi:hypothetical protein